MKHAQVFRATLFLWLSLLNPALAQNLVSPDVLYSENHSYTLQERGDSVGLVSEHSVSIVYKSPASLQQTHYSVHEQFHSLIKNMKAQFNDESISSFSTRALPFYDVYISDAKEKYFDLPSRPAIDDKVRYSYSREHAGLAFFPLHYVPNLNMIDEYVVTINVPDGYSAQFEVSACHPGLAYSIDSTEKGSIRIRFSNLLPYPKRSYFPFNEYHAAILTQIWRNGELLTATTPRKFADWYLPLLPHSESLDKATIDKLTPVVAQANTAKEKLRALYDYVRKNIHYIADEYSINGYVPRPATLVCQRLYGDCKDRAFLLRELAAHFHLPVQMVMINIDDDPPFKALTPLKYNHVIAYAKLDNEEIFMDPTSKYTEFGNIPGSEIGKKVLILDAQNPRTQIIPPPNTSVGIELRIRCDSSLRKGQATIIVRNDDAIGAKRRIEERTEAKEVERYIRNMVNGLLPGVEISHTVLTQQNDSTLEFRAQADIEKLIVQDGANLIIPANPFFSYAAIGERLGDSLGIYHSWQFRAALQIELKTRHREIHQDMTTGNAALAQFSARIDSKDGERLMVSYNFSRPERVFEGEKKQRYTAFLNDFVAARAKVFIVEAQ